MRQAHLLKTTLVEGPHPPPVDRIRGVRVPCSTWRILCSYALVFPILCLHYVELVDDEMLKGAKKFDTKVGTPLAAVPKVLSFDV